MVGGDDGGVADDFLVSGAAGEAKSLLRKGRLDIIACCLAFGSYSRGDSSLSWRRLPFGEISCYL